LVLVAVFAQKTFGKQQRCLGNVLMDVKISKIPEFPIFGQPREIVRNFRNSVPEINVFHLIFKQDFRNFRQMESVHDNTGHLVKYVDPVLGLDQN
jgi:hypothetical protein